MLPYAHEIIGNWSLTAQWLELFTGHQVSISEEDFPLYDLPESLQKRLGGAVLGQDLVLGNSFSDGIPAVKIVFEEMEAGELAGLLPGGEEHAFLEEHFVQYLLPVETPYSIGAESKATDTPFELNPDNEANVLGYTTHL
jgi:predicted component of type VI protein secretion system